MHEKITNRIDLQMAFDVSHNIRLTCGRILHSTAYQIRNETCRLGYGRIDSSTQLKGRHFEMHLSFVE